MTTIDLKTQHRSARDVLAASRVTVEPALRAAINTLPPAMMRIAAYHFGWCNEHGHPEQPTERKTTGGKAIRPTLVLLSAEAVGGVAAAAVPAAVALELVHNFSLLHDDVMDGDLTRRHRRTAWSVFGVNAAILAGNALLALALDVLAASGHPAATDGTRMLTAAVQQLVEGQSADLDLEQRADVECDECLRMAECKTGALMGCACAMGASFGAGDLEQVGRLRRYGIRLGLAFQHVDDLLGIWGDPAVTGKSIYSDLRSRKKSLPVVAALTSHTQAGRELAALYHRGRSWSEIDLVHAAELIEFAGGRAWSQSQVDDLLAQAMRELTATNSTARAVAELGAIARLATHRDH
jgi:geranylgeranyl diphosphate synthase type I